MPPKGARRPAAAQPPRLHRRRPAAAIEAAPPAVREGDLRSRGIAEWAKLGLVRIEGKYWDEPCCLAGKVEGVDQEDQEPYLRLRVHGTQSESLLRVLSGLDSKVLAGHLCENPCTRLTWRNNLVHVTKVEEVAHPGEPWMSNLLDVGGPPPREDELEG